MTKTTFWQLVPFLLPVISYVLGRSLSRLRVPKQVRRLLENSRVLDLFAEGVRTADGFSDMSEGEKREYVRTWAHSELQKAFGQRMPDSVINYLIEHAVLRLKSAKRSNGGSSG